MVENCILRCAAGMLPRLTSGASWREWRRWSQVASPGGQLVSYNEGNAPGTRVPRYDVKPEGLVISFWWDRHIPRDDLAGF